MTSTQRDAVLVRLRRLAAGEAHELSVVERTDSELVLKGVVGDVQKDDEVRIRVGEHVGIGRVIAVEAGLVRLTVLALGIDPSIIEVTTRVSLPGGPPKIPGVLGGPPPLRLSDVGGVDPEEAVTVVAKKLDPKSSIAFEVEELRVRKPNVVIGIDLGTTNTCASYVLDGQPKIIPGRTGKNTIPSMISFEPDGSFHIGQRAADRQILYPTRTVYGSKRLLGRTFRPELAAELQRHFAYPIAESSDQRFGARIDDRVISMDTIAARVLDEVRSSAEAHLGKPVDAAVITVPAYFSEMQREAVRRAAAQAKLVVHRIVNEPTAAAVAYGHKQSGSSRVAVWDFGGGTFDISVVDLSQGKLEVIATGGDNFVGGSDFDDILASHLFTEFRKANEGIDVDATPQQIARLRNAAEEAKCALSTEDEAVVELIEFTVSPKRNLRVVVPRATFDELTLPLVERTIAIAQEVMEAKGIKPTEIDDVILVGGTTRIPAVQAVVATFFGRKPSKRINPDEAVAQGAALLADEIGTTPTLLDVLPMSVGRGIAGRRCEILVPRHARLPTKRELILQADVLGSVQVPLFQGESQNVSENEYLCTVCIEDRSLWDQGVVRLTLSFDEHCVMAVEARNAKTGGVLQPRLDRSRPLDEVLLDLGLYSGPETKSLTSFKLPETMLGRVFGRLSKMFGK